MRLRSYLCCVINFLKVSNDFSSASNWITAMPLKEYDYFLHKGDFRDALCLRYGWHLNNLPAKGACGESKSVDYALVCRKGGYTIIRHNAIGDFTETLLREVCPNIDQATSPTT